MSPFFRVPSPSHLVLAAGLFVTIPAGFARCDDAPADRSAILHVLNRITFGPRPGDVEMVQKMGLHAYIEQQLHPETIDDSATDQEVAKLTLYGMSAQELASIYRDEKVEKKEKKREERAILASDPSAGAAADAAAAASGKKKAGQQFLLEMAEKQQAAAATNAAPASPTAPVAENTMDPVAAATPPETGKKHGKKHEDALAGSMEDKNHDEWKSNAAIEQLEQAKLVKAVDSQRQLQEVLADFWNNHFNVDVKKKVCRIYKISDDRDAIRPHILGKFRDLLEASAKSPAMLYYLDNASNTAPVDPDAGGKKGKLAANAPAPGGETMEAAANAPATGGENMQAEAATAPAATAPAPATMTAAAAVPPAKIKKKKAFGINENYAREVMELHTLGVDGGYTQKDVQEVARCFTGWTVDRATGEFVFKAREHDNGSKVVLGHQIPAGGGMQDGETVLDILASSPATAHHLALELCQRFVSDNPSDALVDRIAGVYTSTGGDLRQVTEAILTSPEFLSPSDYGTKIKSPFEYSVSAVRASGSTIVPVLDNDKKEKKFASREGDGIRNKQKAADKLSDSATQSLNWRISEMGEPLFACTPPTGYKEISTVWVNPGALVERLNFALALTGQQLSDVRFTPDKILAGADPGKPDAVLQQCEASLLQNGVSPGTQKILEQTAQPTGDAKTVDPSKLIALIIGSPDFQRK